MSIRPPQDVYRSVSLNTRARTHTDTRTRAHTHTHTRVNRGRRRRPNPKHNGRRGVADWASPPPPVQAAAELDCAVSEFLLECSHDTAGLRNLASAEVIAL